MRSTDKKNGGSISIEAAVGVLLISLIIFFSAGFLQYIYVYEVLENAVLKAAEDFSAYSCVFYKSGLDSLSDKVKAKVLEAVSGEGDASKFVSSIAGTAFDKLESGAFTGVLYAMIEANIDAAQESSTLKFIKIESVSLLGSEFFETGTGFTICASAKSDYIFPNFDFAGKGIDARVCIKGNGWLYGGCTRYTAEEINVWELDNFKRGVVLEEIFDSNLPLKFPTIDIFDEKTGTATMLVSIDITSPSYQKSGALKRKILEYAGKLYAFNGGECDGVSVDKNEIKERQLLVIYPENEKSADIINEMLEAANNCATKYNIKVKAKDYQISHKYGD